jgi:hypothetical protein
MRIIELARQAVPTLGRRLGRGGLGLLLAGAALIPATTSLAAPQAGCATPPAGQTVLQCVIAFGDSEIARRDTALNTFSGKVTTQTNAKHITSDQANALQQDVTTNLNGLATLKTTLDAATTVPDARKDVALIYTQFRIFAVVLPRDTHHLWLDLLSNIDQKMKDADGKIQDAIDKTSKDEDRNGDKAAIAAAFQDYKNQLSSAEGQIDGALGLLPTLTPAQYDDKSSPYRTNYTDYVNDIHTAGQDIKSAAADLKKIVALLKDLRGKSKAPVAPTATASA